MENTSQLKKEIGNRLREFREHKDLTQTVFAGFLGVSKRGIQDNESGKNIPGGLLLLGLHRMGLNIVWLLSGEGDMIIKGTEKLSVFDSHV